MREIGAILGWLTPLYLVCVLCHLPNEMNMLLFYIFFFGLILHSYKTDRNSVLKNCKMHYLIGDSSITVNLNSNLIVLILVL